MHAIKETWEILLSVIRFSTRSITDDDNDESDGIKQRKR